MKGGGCKEEFEGWEKCVQEAEEAGGDVAESCFQVTATLHKCMEAHFDYYKPILMAERAMLADLEAEKASAVEEGAADAGGKKAAEEDAAAGVPEKEDAAA
uniref:GCK domain-containing protein n=1 Tax=Leersia perrieri TaxID=77586 RepID=A0A0D9VWW3_9ORYZ